jgi:hypothetical protein
VDEFLRFESSNQLGNRRATAACCVGGVRLPEGALVTLCIGAANRDPASSRGLTGSTWSAATTGTWRSASASTSARA